MATYLLTYHGGEMPETDEERARSSHAWDEWLATLGPAVVVAGDTLGPSRTILADGTVVEEDENGTDRPGGYSVIAADDLDEALELASGCPILEVGGNVRVGEAVPMA